MTIGKSLGMVSPVAPKNFKQILESYCQYAGIVRAVEAELPDVLRAYKHVFDVPTLVGLEIEVENIKKDLPMPDFWDGSADGSLRNGGREFKTVPLLPEQGFSALVVLWQILNKMTNQQADFSWRTSMHVHLNVLDMDAEELKRLLILSLIFEDLFFELAGKDREQSIFCVPLTQSTHMRALRGFVKEGVGLKNCAQHWHKYSSINLSRLMGDGHNQALGTVEFRHLGGTSKLPVVCTWLSLLLQLYKAAISLSTMSIKNRVSDLNTSSKYMDFVHTVFTPEVANRLQVKDFSKLFSNTISKAKELYCDVPKFDVMSKDSLMYAFAESSMHSLRER